jgi:hypothetical protein
MKLQKNCFITSGHGQRFFATRVIGAQIWKDEKKDIRVTLKGTPFQWQTGTN